MTESTTSQSRNDRVFSACIAMLDAQVGKGGLPLAPMGSAGKSLVEALVQNLQRESPSASQAAEAVFVLANFSIVEGRVLNLVDPGSTDTGKGGRIAGDRTVGDRLCVELTKRNIPATKGPFQSSSFRGGYCASQVRDDGMRKFIKWVSAEGRTLAEVSALATSLAQGFIGASAELPVLPNLAASRFTFARYRQAREGLLSIGSGGAFEQYLLAGLLREEIGARPNGLRVSTKSVSSNDRASGSSGDIEIRSAKKLVSAIEVSAASWETKVGQVQTAAESGLREMTIAATAVPVSDGGDRLQRLLAEPYEGLGVDVSVVELYSYMDIVASRLTPHQRASAFRFVYACLVAWHRRDRDLVDRLVDVLVDLSLVNEVDELERGDGKSSPVDNLLDSLTAVLSREGSGVADVPVKLRQLADEIESGFPSKSAGA